MTFKITIDFTNTLIHQTKLALGTLMHYTTREREKERVPVLGLLQSSHDEERCLQHC